MLARLLDLGASAWSRLPFGARYAVLHAVNPKFLVGVVGLVDDGTGRVLLLEHRFRTPHRWGLPGGFIKRGEPLRAALERELREETGLLVTADPHVLDVELNDAGGYLSIAMAARAHPGATLALSGEILDGGWFAPDALPPGTYPYHAAVIQRVAHARSTA